MIRSGVLRRAMAVLIGVWLVLAPAGCAPPADVGAITQSQPPATRTVESTEDTQATLRGNAVATLEAVATGTAAATTPTATVTAQVAPTFPPASDVPLSEEGPWLLFLASDSVRVQLWAMNADGSGLKQLTRHTEADVVRFEVNPTAAPDDSYEVAYTVASYSDDVADDAAWLHLLRLPGGTSQELTPLTPQGAPGSVPATIAPDNPTIAYERMNAITFMKGALRWSPDGRQLAFVGAIQGPTADVYVYTGATGEIVQLTDGPAHAWNLLWSPDGRYIVHTGNDWFMGSGSRYVDGRVWAVRADGSGTTEFPGHGVGYVGWLAPDTLLLYTGPDLVCAYDLRTVNIDSGIVYHIVPVCFGQVAYDLTNNIALITFSDYPARVGIENADIPPEGPGTYFLKEGRFELLSTDVLSVYWSPGHSTFYGGDIQGRVYEVIPEEGQLIELDAPTRSFPYLSPDGRYRAWSGTSTLYGMPLSGRDPNPPAVGLWIDRPDGARVQVDTGQGFDSTGAEYVIWAPDSEHIFFIGNDIGYIVAVPDFIPQPLPISIPDSFRDWQFQWVP